MPKKSYFGPKAHIQKHSIFGDPREEVPSQDLAAVEILRPIFLLNLQPNLIPKAARITVAAQRHPSGWLKVLQYPESPIGRALEQRAGDWYFLSHVPHSSEIAIELQTLSPDGKVRIAVAEKIVVPEEKKLWLVVLQRGEVRVSGSPSCHQTATL